MKTTCWICSVLVNGALLAAAPPPDEFAELQRQIAACPTWNCQRLAREACRPEALIGPGDRTPVDVVWRRTHALLAHLRAMPGAPNLTAAAAELAALQPRVEALAALAEPNEGEQREVFAALVAARRRLAFQNPLLDFRAIVFLKHDKQARGEVHMVDQYLGFNAAARGGVYVLEDPWGKRPTVRSVLADAPVQTGRLAGQVLEDRGSFVGLDLDYDARSILFSFTEGKFDLPAEVDFADQYCTPEELRRSGPRAAHYHFCPQSTYHVFSARIDGTELRQLTDGRWNDLDPCFLPSGRIAFISERAGGQVRCGMRPLPSATLHAMQRDGDDVIQLSWHDTQEWQPSVDHQGRLVYTRWDYVDRDSDVAHHLWLCYPDGRDPRSPHGNYPERRELRPWMELSLRAVPGSRRYVAVAAPHHGQAYGSLVLVDAEALDDRGTSQVRRLTPEVPFPESESAPGVPHDKGRHDPRAEVYGTPWPLDEDFYLCVYDPGQRHYGIYLVDCFGNRELLYRDPHRACLDPIPLKPRTCPPVIPPGTLQAQSDRAADADLSTGVVAVMNVYDSDLPLPAGAKVAQIRVVNLFPKDNPFQDEPNIGVAPQSLARGVLGVAPVEPDGSAHFRVPAGAPIYFQLLDERGLAVQSMRSDTYVHPGETLTCVGCHENKQRPARAPAGAPLALQRPPSALVPEVPDAYPLTFTRLVQPVLNVRCVPCHDGQPTSPSLHGDRFGKLGWSEAFITLAHHAWGRSGGNGVALQQRQYSVPGEEGARAASLFRLLEAGHYDVALAPDELRRITLWLDCNSNFYGAYTEPAAQAKGALVAPRWGLPRWSDFDALVRSGTQPPAR